jgi:hypothetical protein
MQYLWSLRDQTANLNQTITNTNQNLTQQITTLSGQVANAANNNNSTPKPAVIFGSHALRLATSATTYSGYFFIETDRNNALYWSTGSQWILVEATSSGSFENRYLDLGPFDGGFNWYENSRNNVNANVPLPYYQWSGSAWNLISGQWYRNQNAVATLSGTFGANSSNDVGALVNVTDFAGQLQWQNNNTFTWGPEDSRMHGMGPIFAEVDPNPTTGWALYDGSNNVSYLQANGNTGTVNLPDLSGANASGNTFTAAGNVNGNINAPVAPVFTGNAAAGTISTPTFTGALGATSAPTFTGNSNTFSTANFTALLGGNAALVSPTSITPSGAVSPATFTPTGNVSTPTFTGNNVTGSVSNNGTPQNIVRRAWFRK